METIVGYTVDNLHDVVILHDDILGSDVTMSVQQARALAHRLLVVAGKAEEWT